MIHFSLLISRFYLSSERLSFILVALALLTVACSDRGREGGIIGERGQQAPEGLAFPFAQDDNSIAVSAVPSYEERGARLRNDCVVLRINLMHMKERGLEGSATVINNCDVQISVLTAPLEARLLVKEGDFYVNEVLVEPLYARLYIYRKEIGMGDRSFLGDGGLEVTAWPSYLSIESHANKRVLFRNAVDVNSKLPPGEYEALLVTLVAPSRGGDAGISYFDLRQSVDAYNRQYGRMERLVRRASAVEISSEIVSFKVD